MNLLLALASGLTAAVLVFLLLASLCVPGFFKRLLRVALRPLVLGVIAAWALMMTAAVTQINLTTQVQGVLPSANGGTNSQYFGISGPTAARTYTLPDSAATLEWQANKDAASGYAGLTAGSLLKCAEAFALTGDTTMSSGACATVVAAIHGTSVPTNSASDQVLLTTAAATGSWANVGSCSGGTNALTYNTSTHAFGCNTGFGAIPNFSDGEAPTGSCPTTSLTLAHTPNPLVSLSLSMNGQWLIQGASNDYTVSGTTVTLASSCATGTLFRANYRY